MLFPLPLALLLACAPEDGSHVVSGTMYRREFQAGDDVTIDVGESPWKVLECVEDDAAGEDDFSMICVDATRDYHTVNGHFCANATGDCVAVTDVDLIVYWWDVAEE